MWIWILLAALANQSLVSSLAESIGSEFQEELPDDSMYLYLEERSIKDNSEDIEARRRSALDKNFMRFGRGGSDLFLQKHVLDPDDVDYYNDNEFNRPQRTIDKNGNFIRFGRGKAGDFIRFGRDPSYLREIRGRDQNRIRFGRSVPVKRSKRNAELLFNEEEKRRTNNMLRFGRNNGNFMRFGRLPPIYKTEKQQQQDDDDDDNIPEEENQHDQHQQGHVTRQKVIFPSDRRMSVPVNYWPVLQNFAASLRYTSDKQQKCIDATNCRPSRQG